MCCCQFKIQQSLSSWDGKVSYLQDKYMCCCQFKIQQSLSSWDGKVSYLQDKYMCCCQLKIQQSLSSWDGKVSLPSTTVFIFCRTFPGCPPSRSSHVLSSPRSQWVHHFRP